MLSDHVRFSILRSWHGRLVATVALALLVAGGCSKRGSEGGGSVIKIDGSSTVFPIIEAVAEEFQKESDAKVTIGVSGTGGGFKKFCAGEIDITGASRPIKQSEIEQCKAKGVNYEQLPVAVDEIAVVVNPDNDWVDAITADELKKVWAPAAQGKIMKWSDIRAGWPDQELHLFGPGVDSGTYDYFTEAVVGKQHASRGDFTSSEDDNVLVQGVAGDKYALGYFGRAYYEENKAKLKKLQVSGAEMSRPLFVYVSKKAAAKPEVKALLQFFLDKGGNLAKEVGYMAPNDEHKAAAAAALERL